MMKHCFSCASIIAKFLSTVVIVVFLFSCSSSSSNNVTQSSDLLQSTQQRDLSPAVSNAEMSELVAGNNTFALGLYNALAQKNEGKNVFYSPYSISTAFAMVYAGARTETETQMASVLDYTLPQDSLHPAFDALALKLAQNASTKDSNGQNDGFTLNIANSIWGQNGDPFLMSYLDILAIDYGAGLRLLDFENADAADIINHWISDQTAGKITNVLQSGSITPATKLVLADAIYFKAAWASKFQTINTTQGLFYRSDGSSVAAPMMNQAAPFNYYAGDGYQAVELPYMGGCSMIVLLPNAGDFNIFENSLSVDGLDSILSKMQLTYMALTMPKFTFSPETVSLTNILSGMGMPQAFESGAADFSGMDGTHSLSIGSALHKAFVSVDENGTEAAAATVITVAGAALGESVVQMNIDRPFIFLIRDTGTNAILFMGRILDPTQQQ